VKLEEVAYSSETLLAHVGVVVRGVRENLDQSEAPAVHLLAAPVDCDRLLLQVELARLDRRRRLILLNQLRPHPPHAQSVRRQGSAKSPQGSIDCSVRGTQRRRGNTLRPTLTFCFLKSCGPGFFFLPLFRLFLIPWRSGILGAGRPARHRSVRGRCASREPFSTSARDRFVDSIEN
jgi:hypothetical protein